MKVKDTYGIDAVKDITLSKLKCILRDKGVRRIYIKHLSPNDNSKNQPYFGGDYSSLNIIPTGNIVAAQSTSKKKMGGPAKKIFKTPLRFSWIGPDGHAYPAPNAQLILYPQYPEVRFSGFLKGSKVKMSQWMDPYKDGRSQGRVLVLGVTDNGEVLGFLAVPGSLLSNELSLQKGLSVKGVFFELPCEEVPAGVGDSKAQLFAELKRIHLAGWIKSKRLDGVGHVMDCNNPNCGGYTLEAELGITPNGYSEPDYLGWELKQFGVDSFDKLDAKVVTLMTPEPTGGVYKDDGVSVFLQKFGYKDLLGRPDRINFGGVHRFGEKHARTGLVLRLDGYDEKSGRITDAEGGMVLETAEGEVAAKWHYSGLIEHWRRKHSQAAYVPSKSRKNGSRSYQYGNTVKIGEGTDFSRFLQSVSLGDVYYDPGIKMEKVSSPKPTIKRRSQFRIKTGRLGSLYHAMSHIDVTA